MSASNETTLTTIQAAFSADLQKSWGWLLALGLVSIVLGTLGLYMTFALTLASVLFFGVLILVAGVFQLVHAFTCTGWKSVLWHVLIALLYIAAGSRHHAQSGPRIHGPHPGAGRHPDCGRCAA